MLLLLRHQHEVEGEGNKFRYPAASHTRMCMKVEKDELNDCRGDEEDEKLLLQTFYFAQLSFHHRPFHLIPDQLVSLISSLVFAYPNST